MCMCWVRTAEMELPLVKLTVEPLRIQRVIADVARDTNTEIECNGIDSQCYTCHQKSNYSDFGDVHKLSLHSESE